MSPREKQATSLADDGADSRTGPPLHYTAVETPIGTLTVLVTGDGLAAITFPDDQSDSPLGRVPARLADHDTKENSKACAPAVAWLNAYFAGRRPSIAEVGLALDMGGTEFEASVWQLLAEIPYGETRSYGELAELLDRPGAARAVGLANGKNPLPVLIPCHRVIGASGKLTGFGGGLWRKEWLLQHEGDGWLPL